MKEKELMRKRLNRHISSFDYFDKFLIILSVKCGSISISSFSTVIGAPVGIESASFSLEFSYSTVIVNFLKKTARNKKKKHNIVIC